MRLFNTVVHARQLIVEQCAVVTQFQQLGVGHFDHIGNIRVTARFVDERAIPGEHDEIVGEVGIRMTREVAAHCVRQRALFRRE